jgi:hypothetical protein
MIKVNQDFDDDFITQYKALVMNASVLPKLDNYYSSIPDDIKQVMESVFSRESVEELATMTPEDLRNKIDQVYQNIPLLAEFYCPEYYYSFIEGAFKTDLIDIHDPNQLRLLREGKDELIYSISNHVATHGYKLHDYFLEQLRETTSPSGLKSLIEKIYNFKTGVNRKTPQFKRLFPDWVNNFSDLFDYGAMANQFGRIIVSTLSVDICPYCNEEDIESIETEGAEYRPALDHFYPKAKFPFLALSLGNLVPAGDRCNSTYKEASSMLFSGVSPYTAGVQNEPMCSFLLSEDEGISSGSLEVGFTENNDEYEYNFDLFNLKAVYNKTSVKKEVTQFFTRYEWNKSLGLNELSDVLDDNAEIQRRLNINLDEPAISYRLKKLLVDALNFKSGRNFRYSE